MNDIATTQPALDADAAWEQWRLRLLSRFEALSGQDSPANLYVLADGRANPGLDQLLAKVPGLSWRNLWEGSVLESYTDIAPYLIHVRQAALEAPRELAGRLARRIWMDGASRHTLTWIWSPFSLDALNEHLKHHALYSTPDKRGFFLHFYDNRILERLRKVWAEPQENDFVAPCNEIWYSDRDFSPIVWRNEKEPALIDLGDAHELSAEQHAGLLALGHADKLAMQLREMYGSRLDAYSEADLHRRVIGQLDRASRYRLKDDDDFLNYVVKGVMLSPRFDEHPVIQERLTRALNGEISHREALTGLDRGVIKEVARMAGPQNGSRVS